MSKNATTNYLLSRHALPTKTSKPPYAAGITLESEEISAIPAYRWPTHAAVPWPEGTVRGRYFRLGIFENGREIPSHEMDVQTWDRHGVDLRWSHLHFIWTKGRRYMVKGVSRARPVPTPARPLRVFDGANAITVEIGKLRAVVSKSSFALFDEIQFDSEGKGRYRTQILNGSRGPEIFDNGTTWAARFDSRARVSVEVEGPVYAVIKAEGVYQDAGQTGSGWANFITRIHFWAGQEWVRVVHNLGYSEDMAGHEYDHAAILMPFNFAERFAFAADDDTGAHKDDFSNHGGDDLYLHQEKHDSYRFGTDAQLNANVPMAVGTRSNNSWAIQSAADKVRVECYLRNGWQEFPFEAKVGQAEMGLSMQPWHGYETFGALTGNDHTGEDNIHKLRYAHAGPKQRQGLPVEYVNAFNAIDSARTSPETTLETNANDAASSNWQGMMLRQDFYLRILRDRASSLARFDTDSLLHFARLVQHRPIAIPDASHVQRSFVFGPIGRRNDGYDEIFDYVTDIIKGDYNPERGEYYGRFRWSALPHNWEIASNRPNWHRLEYGDSHYDRIALIFWYYMATGDAELLEVARKAVKFHQCFRYINYDDASLPNHALMNQWHKGLTPCANTTTDDASNRSGHTVHAYSMLAGWLIDADLDLRDAYRRWSDNAHHHTVGRDRNINNNVHEAIQQYEFFHDRRIKAAIKGMTASLISEPMSVPVPSDRDWDKAWPLYLDLFGGKGVRQFFQNEATPGQWLHGSGNSAHMALCYRITGDKSFLERALKPLRSYVLRGIFRTSGGRYSPAFFQNGYGQPEIHKTLLHFLYYLKQAGITAIPEDDGESGQYPVGSASFNSEADVKSRGIWIPIYNPTGGQMTLQIRLATVGGGSLHTTGVFLYDPNGSELLQTLAPDVIRFDEVDGVGQARASGWSEFLRQVTIPMGPAGRYDLFMGSHQAGQFLPTTAEGLSECAVIRNSYRTPAVTRERAYRASLTKMYVLPKTTSYEIEWTFTPIDPRNGCRIRVYDAADNLFTDAYLIRNEPGHESLTLRMNGAGDPPIPWRMDCGPVYSVEAASAAAFNNGVENLALIGPDMTVLTTMQSLIPLSGW